jgi:endonuclease YncB( thermonuclease family)
VVQVFEVVSGDTLVIGVARGAGIEERRVSLASIRAPRLGNARAGTANAPFSWEVRCCRLLCTVRIARASVWPSTCTS